LLAGLVAIIVTRWQSGSFSWSSNFNLTV